MKDIAFDYLDYKENEERLEKLRQINSNLFNHIDENDNN